MEGQRFATTYFIADFDLDQIKSFAENFKVIPCPMKINMHHTNLIYHSAEPGYIPLPVQQVPITYGNVHICGLQALNGYAEPHLYKIWIQFAPPYKTVIWYAVFDQEPDQKDFQIQKVASNSFASAFGAQSETVVHLLSEEGIPKAKEMRLIFERKDLNYVDE